MLTFVLLFFLLICGIAACFIVISARKRAGAQSRERSPNPPRSNPGRASGSVDD